MVEFVARSVSSSGARTNWDAIPQLQIPLNKRMHVLASVATAFP